MSRNSVTRSLKLVLLVITPLLICACRDKGFTSKSPSGPDARELLEALLNKSVHYILTGDATVVSGASDFNHRQISQEEYREVVAWSKAGLISLSEQDVLSSKKNFNWNDWLNRTQRGELKKIKVTPTPEGLRLQSESKVAQPLDKRLLYARLSIASVDEIVDDEEVRKAPNLYRVVMGKLSTHWNSTGAKIYSARGWPMPEHGKIIALLRYDFFEKRWDLWLTDLAGVGEGFHTNNVEKYLALLRPTGGTLLE